MTPTPEEMIDDVAEAIKINGSWEFDYVLKKNAIKAMKDCIVLVAQEKDKEIEKLKTAMIAAAEEIQRVWAAHCDESGYGPANLMRRLEEGIPSQYGYTSGAFETMQKQLEEKDKRIAELSGIILSLNAHIENIAKTLNHE